MTKEEGFNVIKSNLLEFLPDLDEACGWLSLLENPVPGATGQHGTFLLFPHPSGFNPPGREPGCCKQK